MLIIPYWYQISSQCSNILKCLIIFTVDSTKDAKESHISDYLMPRCMQCIRCLSLFLSISYHPPANDWSPFFCSLIPTLMFTHSFGETSHMGFHCLPFLVRSVLGEELSWILKSSLWATLSFGSTSLDPPVFFRKHSEAWPSLHEIHVGCSLPCFSLVLLVPVALRALFCALEGLPPMVSAQFVTVPWQVALAGLEDLGCSDAESHQRVLASFFPGLAAFLRLARTCSG